MKRLFGILTVMLCATSMSYAQADEIVTVKTSDIEMPLNGATANGKVIKSGNCGENVKYELYDDYTLRIYGNGTMHDFCVWVDDEPHPTSVPWVKEREKIVTVVIDNGVTHIGDNSFYSCSSLTKVTIPNSVTSIGEDAFSICTSLTKITIPNSVKSIGDCVFSNCSTLADVTISNSITSIGHSAFSNCSSLAHVTIPNGVASIGSYAFEYCPLAEIAIPNSVMSIGEGAFRACTPLTKITIPNSVTSIEDCAFEDCNNLKYIKIGKNVTKIGDRIVPQRGDDDLVIEITSETPAALSNVEAFGFLCTIYVPENALETYLNAKFWKDHADQILPKEQTTGISSIEREQSEKETAIFDLQGHKVTEVQPNRIYIVNGKKVVNMFRD